MHIAGLSALLALMLGSYGCARCEKCASLSLMLPALDKAALNAPVSVEIRPSNQQTVVASCTWSRSAYAGGTWTCSKDSDGVVTKNEAAVFTYTVDPELAKKSWQITLSGPTAVNTIARDTEAEDSGGEWPTGCHCDVYNLRLTGADTKEVGAPPLGSSATSPSAAGANGS